MRLFDAGYDPEKLGGIQKWLLNLIRTLKIT